MKIKNGLKYIGKGMVWPVKQYLLGYAPWLKKDCTIEDIMYRPLITGLVNMTVSLMYSTATRNYFPITLISNLPIFTGYGGALAISHKDELKGFYEKMKLTPPMQKVQKLLGILKRKISRPKDVDRVLESPQDAEKPLYNVMVKG